MKFFLFILIFCIFSLTGSCAPDVYYVSVGGAGDKSGTTPANAFDFAAFESDCENNQESGDIYYILTGTYTLTSNFSNSGFGSSALPIQFIGVTDLDTLDEATGDDRPFFTCGAFSFVFGGSKIVKNLEFQITTTNGVETGYQVHLFNNKIQNDSEEVGRVALRLDSGDNKVIGCEVISDKGIGIYSFEGDHLIIGTWVHDTPTPLDFDSFHLITVINSCFSDFDSIEIYSSTAFVFNGCDFYNFEDEAINVGIFAGWHVVTNCIFDGNGIGDSAVTFASQINSGFIDYNVYHDITNNVVNGNEGENSLEVDPQFVDPDNGDFTIQNESLKAVGFPLSIAEAQNYLDIGALQTEAIEGGGSSGENSSNSETSFFGSNQFVSIR